MTEVSRTIGTKEFCPFDLLTGLKAVALLLGEETGLSQDEWFKVAAVPVMLVPIVQLVKLDNWLRELSSSDLQLLAAGELQGRAPDPELCNTLLNKIMDA